MLADMSMNHNLFLPLLGWDYAFIELSINLVKCLGMQKNKS